MEAAGAMDAQNAPTAPWKTHRAGFPQLPQVIFNLATEREMTARLCHLGDREAVSLRPRGYSLEQHTALLERGCHHVASSVEELTSAPVLTAHGR